MQVNPSALFPFVSVLLHTALDAASYSFDTKIVEIPAMNSDPSKPLNALSFDRCEDLQNATGPAMLSKCIEDQADS